MLCYRAYLSCVVGAAILSAHALVTADDEGLPITFEWSDTIYEAVFENDLPRLKSLLDQQPNLVFATKKITKLGGATLLHNAARFGHLEIVRELMRRGADINAKSVGFNELGGTPLHHAASSGHAKMVQFLLKAGASIEEPLPDGRTALQLASLNNHLETAQTLVDEGASLDIFSAAGLGETDFLGQQLKQDSELARSLDGDRATPLHYAVSCGNIESAEILLRAKADVNAQDRTRWGMKGSTPLHLTAQHGHIEMVEWLLKNGADVNAVGGFAALHCAAGDGNIPLTKLLMQHGANVNVRTEFDGRRPLHSAALAGNVEIARLLIEAGADVNAITDRAGGVSAPPRPPMRTPMDWAVEYKKKDIVKLLDKHGGKLNRGDSKELRQLLATARAEKVDIERNDPREN